MKILAMERELPGAAAGQFQPYLRSEAARLWELYQEGVVREFYFRAGQRSAVLILECAGADEAKLALATLPLIQAGLIEFDVIPLAPYPGFARLTAETG